MAGAPLKSHGIASFPGVEVLETQEFKDSNKTNIFQETILNNSRIYKEDNDTNHIIEHLTKILDVVNNKRNTETDPTKKNNYNKFLEDLFKAYIQIADKDISIQGEGSQTISSFIDILQGNDSPITADEFTNSIDIQTILQYLQDMGEESISSDLTLLSLQNMENSLKTINKLVDPTRYNSYSKSLENLFTTLRNNKDITIFEDINKTINSIHIDTKQLQSEISDDWGKASYTELDGQVDKLQEIANQVGHLHMQADAMLNNNDIDSLSLNQIVNAFTIFSNIVNTTNTATDGLIGIINSNTQLTTEEKRKIIEKCKQLSNNNNKVFANKFANILHDKISQRIINITKDQNSNLNQITKTRGLGSTLDSNIRSSGQAATNLAQATYTYRETQKNSPLFSFGLSSSMSGLHKYATVLSRLEMEYSQASQTLSQLHSQAEKAFAEGNTEKGNQLLAIYKKQIGILVILVERMNDQAEQISHIYNRLPKSQKESLDPTFKENIQNVLKQQSESSRNLLVQAEGLGIKIDPRKLKNFTALAEQFEEYNKEIDKQKENNINLVQKLKSAYNEARSIIYSLRSGANNFLNTFGLGSVALGPFSVATQTFEYSVEQGRKRYASMSADAYIGVTDLDRSAQLAQQQMLAGNELYRMSGGRINQYAIRDSYEYMVRNMGAAPGTKPEQVSSDMAFFAENTALLQNVYGLDQSTITSGLQVFYRDMRMSAGNAANAFAKLTQQAMAANVPIDQYISTFNEIAKQYMTIGISGEKAGVVLDHLARNHIRIDIAKEVAGQLGQALSTFSQDKNKVAFAAYIQGRDPFEALGQIAYTHDSKGDPREGWVDDAVSLADTYINTVMDIVGGDENNQRWLLTDILRQQFGMDRRAASMLASDYLENGNTEQFKKHFMDEMKKADNPNATLEDLNQTALNHLQKMTRQLAKADRLEAELKSNLFSSAQAFGNEIDQLLKAFAPLLFAIQGTMLEVTAKIVEWLAKLATSDLFKEGMDKIKNALAYLPKTLAAFFGFIFFKKIGSIIWNIASSILGPIAGGLRNLLKNPKMLRGLPAPLLGAAAIASIAYNFIDEDSSIMKSLKEFNIDSFNIDDIKKHFQLFDIDKDKNKNEPIDESIIDSAIDWVRNINFIDDKNIFEIDNVKKLASTFTDTNQTLTDMRYQLYAKDTDRQDIQLIRSLTTGEYTIPEQSEDLRTEDEKVNTLYAQMTDLIDQYTNPDLVKKDKDLNKEEELETVVMGAVMELPEGNESTDLQTKTSTYINSIVQQDNKTKVLIDNKINTKNKIVTPVKYDINTKQYIQQYNLPNAYDIINSQLVKNQLQTDTLSKINIDKSIIPSTSSQKKIIIDTYQKMLPEYTNDQLLQYNPNLFIALQQTDNLQLDTVDFNQFKNLQFTYDFNRSLIQIPTKIDTDENIQQQFLEDTLKQQFGFDDETASKIAANYLETGNLEIDTDENIQQQLLEDTLKQQFRFDDETVSKIAATYLATGNLEIDTDTNIQQQLLEDTLKQQFRLDDETASKIATNYLETGNINESLQAIIQQDIDSDQFLIQAVPSQNIKLIRLKKQLNTLNTHKTNIINNIADTQINIDNITKLIQKSNDENEINELIDQLNKYNIRLNTLNKQLEAVQEDIEDTEKNIADEEKNYQEQVSKNFDISTLDKKIEDSSKEIEEKDKDTSDQKIRVFDTTFTGLKNNTAQLHTFTTDKINSMDESATALEVEALTNASTIIKTISDNVIKQEQDKKEKDKKEKDEKEQIVEESVKNSALSEEQTSTVTTTIETIIAAINNAKKEKEDQEEERTKDIQKDSTIKEKKSIDQSEKEKIDKMAALAKQNTKNIINQKKQSDTAVLGTSEELSKDTMDIAIHETDSEETKRLKESLLKQKEQNAKMQKQLEDAQKVNKELQKENSSLKDVANANSQYGGSIGKKEVDIPAEAKAKANAERKKWEQLSKKNINTFNKSNIGHFGTYNNTLISTFTIPEQFRAKYTGDFGLQEHFKQRKNNYVQTKPESTKLFTDTEAERTYDFVLPDIQIHTEALKNIANSKGNWDFNSTPQVSEKYTYTAKYKDTFTPGEETEETKKRKRLKEEETKKRQEKQTKIENMFYNDRTYHPGFSNVNYLQNIMQKQVVDAITNQYTIQQGSKTNIKPIINTYANAKDAARLGYSVVISPDKIKKVTRPEDNRTIRQQLHDLEEYGWDAWYNPDFKNKNKREEIITNTLNKYKKNKDNKENEKKQKEKRQDDLQAISAAILGTQQEIIAPDMLKLKEYSIEAKKIARQRRRTENIDADEEETKDKEESSLESKESRAKHAGKIKKRINDEQDKYQKLALTTYDMLIEFMELDNDLFADLQGSIMTEHSQILDMIGITHKLLVQMNEIIARAGALIATVLPGSGISGTDTGNIPTSGALTPGNYNVTGEAVTKATLSTHNIHKDSGVTAETLEHFFKGGPLEGKAQEFINICREKNYDPAFIAALIGVEHDYGRNMAGWGPYHNIMSWGVNHPTLRNKVYKDELENIRFTLESMNQMPEYKNAITITDIGANYDNNPAEKWAPNVHKAYEAIIDYQGGSLPGFTGSANLTSSQKTLLPANNMGEPQMFEITSYAAEDDPIEGGWGTSYLGSNTLRGKTHSIHYLAGDKSYSGQVWYVSANEAPKNMEPGYYVFVDTGGHFKGRKNAADVFMGDTNLGNIDPDILGRQKIKMQFTGVTLTPEQILNDWDPHDINKLRKLGINIPNNNNQYKSFQAGSSNFRGVYQGISSNDITSPIGPRGGRTHKGIDFSQGDSMHGQPVFAAGAGTVSYTGWDEDGYGNFVIILHNNGQETLYGHLSSIDVQQGQQVSQNQIIGKIGSTGRSSGAHLHFEVLQNNERILDNDYVYQVATKGINPTATLGAMMQLDDNGKILYKYIQKGPEDINDTAFIFNSEEQLFNLSNITKNDIQDLIKNDESIYNYFTNQEAINNSIFNIIAKNVTQQDIKNILQNNISLETIQQIINAGINNNFNIKNIISDESIIDILRKNISDINVDDNIKQILQKNIKDISKEDINQIINNKAIYNQLIDKSIINEPLLNVLKANITNKNITDDQFQDLLQSNIYDIFQNNISQVIDQNIENISQVDLKEIANVLISNILQENLQQFTLIDSELIKNISNISSQEITESIITNILENTIKELTQIDTKENLTEETIFNELNKQIQKTFKNTDITNYNDSTIYNLITNILQSNISDLLININPTLIEQISKTNTEQILNDKNIKDILTLVQKNYLYDLIDPNSYNFYNIAEATPESIVLGASQTYRPIPGYKEDVSQWSNIPAEFPGALCGTAATADFISSVIGKRITPTDILNRYGNIGKETMPENILKDYGIEFIYIESMNTDSRTQTLANQALRAGIPILIGTDPGSSSPWSTTTNGHYVTAVALGANGELIVSDPGDYQHKEPFAEGNITDLSKYSGGIWIPTKVNGQAIANIPVSYTPTSNTPASNTPAANTPAYSPSGIIQGGGPPRTYAENLAIIAAGGNLKPLEEYYKNMPRFEIPNDAIIATGQIAEIVFQKHTEKIDKINKEYADKTNKDKTKGKNTDTDNKNKKDKVEEVEATTEQPTEEQLKIYHDQSLSSQQIPYAKEDIQKLQEEHPDWTKEQIYTELDKQPKYGLNDTDFLRQYGIKVNPLFKPIEKYIANNMRNGRAPNGQAFSSTDIQKLKDEGLSEKEIIAKLSTEEKYRYQGNNAKYSILATKLSVQVPSGRTISAVHTFDAKGELTVHLGLNDPSLLKRDGMELITAPEVSQEIMPPFWQDIPLGLGISLETPEKKIKADFVAIINELKEGSKEAFNKLNETITKQAKDFIKNYIKQHPNASKEDILKAAQQYISRDISIEVELRAVTDTLLQKIKQMFGKEYANYELLQEEIVKLIKEILQNEIDKAKLDEQKQKPPQNNIEPENNEPKQPEGEPKKPETKI